jgi:hypothetical protein
VSAVEEELVGHARGDADDVTSGQLLTDAALDGAVALLMGGYGFTVKIAGEPVSRILCRTQTEKRSARAAIIPLGHGSHRDSSSLPEGFHSTMAFATAKRSALIFMNAASSSRAGSPLLFGLAPRGVFRAPGVTTGAVGSYPTFSPLPNGASISSASHRFPCAMPPRFTPPAVYSLWHFP